MGCVHARFPPGELLEDMDYVYLGDGLVDIEVHVLQLVRCSSPRPVLPQPPSLLRQAWQLVAVLLTCARH